MKLYTFQTRFGTFGELYSEDNRKICDTLERKWGDNEPYVSCVKRGTYELVEYESKRFGSTYALRNEDLDVGLYQGEAHRFGILFHPANLEHELQGCIAPGQFGCLHKKWAVINSRKSHQALMEYLSVSGDRILTIYRQESLR